MDNGGGEFAGLVPTWPQREIRLSEVMSELLSLGSHIHIVTNTHSGNGPFAHAMRRVAEVLAADTHLNVSRSMTRSRPKRKRGSTESGSSPRTL